MQPAQGMTTAVEKIKTTIPSSRKTGCWLSLYSRWVVSCSPAPWHFYGNKMFVFVYWVAPAKWKALTLYCLTFSLDWLTSLDLFTMEFFFYLFKNRSSSCPYAPRTQKLPPSKNAITFFPSLFLLTPLSLFELLTFCTSFFAIFFPQHLKNTPSFSVFSTLLPASVALSHSPSSFK